VRGWREDGQGLTPGERKTSLVKEASVGLKEGTKWGDSLQRAVGELRGGAMGRVSNPAGKGTAN